MDSFAQRELRSLTAHTSDWCLSIFLPTHRMGRETRQDSLRLRNLLKTAAAELQNMGVAEKDIPGFISHAKALAENSAFWQQQSDGLAIFIAPDFFQTYRIPIFFEESVSVAERFHIVPLLPLMAAERGYCVLLLDRKGSQFFRGNRHELTEVHLPSVALPMDEALKYDDPERQLQSHSTGPARGGQSSVTFHGHGGGTDGNFDDKERLTRFFRLIDSNVATALRGETAPLVLAGVEYYFSLYREINTYPHLAKGGVTGASRTVEPEKLAADTWHIVEPLFLEKQTQALLQRESLAGTGRVVNDSPTVLRAARMGGVDELFVNFPGASTASKAESRLINEACIETLRAGGTVFDGMEAGPNLSAVLRKGAELSLAS